MILIDMEAWGRELLAGANGDALRDAAASKEAASLGERLDPRRVEQAARSGDAAQLRAILSEVLATEEGRALAEKLSKLRM